MAKFGRTPRHRGLRAAFRAAEADRLAGEIVPSFRVLDLVQWFGSDQDIGRCVSDERDYNRRLENRRRARRDHHRWRFDNF